jgi:hypothetical protein
MRKAVALATRVPCAGAPYAGAPPCFFYRSRGIQVTYSLLISEFCWYIFT